MPLITVPIHASNGPIVSASVGVSIPRAQAIIATGNQPPAPVSGLFLLDTGASTTCVDATLIQNLSLPLIGKAMMATPSTGSIPVICDQYDAAVYIPGNTPDGILIIPALPLVAVSLAAQGIHGLIGRDVLDRCQLTYHGPARMVTLAH